MFLQYSDEKIILDIVIETTIKSRNCILIVFMQIAKYLLDKDKKKRQNLHTKNLLSRTNIRGLGTVMGISVPGMFS